MEGQIIKVSVILPSLNVADYIEECVRSAMAQTAGEIEIISVDAGSTDGTAEILLSCAKEDSRIRLLKSERRSYGAQVNMGIEAARGEYIAILETDDYVDARMYETLYQIAEEYEADAVLADYDRVWDAENGTRVSNLSAWADKPEPCRRLLRSRELQREYRWNPNLWSGIFSRDFLIRNEIRLNETPGAAFQDICFMHRVFMNAALLVYTPESYYRYRVDRAASSVHSARTLCYSYHEYRSLLEEGEIKSGFEGRVYTLMARSFFWTVSKALRVPESCLAPENGEAYQWFRRQLRRGKNLGMLRDNMIGSAQWEELKSLPDTLERYALRKLGCPESLFDFVQSVGAAGCVLFGAGQRGSSLCAILKKCLRVDAVCDNNAMLWNTEVCGIPVLPPEECVKRFPGHHYLITAKNWKEEMKEQLLALGTTGEKIYLYDTDAEQREKAVMDLIRELPKGLVKWIEFEKGAQAAVVSASTEIDRSVAAALEERNVRVRQLSAEAEDSPGAVDLDYVFLGPALEQGKSSGKAEEWLRLARRLLKPGGRAFLYLENRLGIRYFCGDRDPYTGRNFDGIEDYKHVPPDREESVAGKLYDKAQIVELLERSGFPRHKFYSVFPSLNFPQILVSEDFEPTEELDVRIFPCYNDPELVFLEEEKLYTPLIRNHIFHAMANGFLVECAADEEGAAHFEPVRQVTVSMDRGKENALSTIIRTDNTVQKRPLYPQGADKIAQLKENMDDLLAHQVPMVPGEVKDGSFVMPFVEGKSLTVYYRELLRSDRGEFLRKMDELWELILRSSEHVPYEEVDWERFDACLDEEESAGQAVDRGAWTRAVMKDSGKGCVFGPILKRGYIDLVVLNGIMTDTDFFFFDQELYVEQLPARSIMVRNVDFLYRGDAELERLLPVRELYRRYGLLEHHTLYWTRVRKTLKEFLNADLRVEFLRAHGRNEKTARSNRRRLNYMTNGGELFSDIFAGLENKKLYLFGAGRYAQKFIAMYRRDYPITAVLDNDPQKQGTEIEGYPIWNPRELSGEDPRGYKVIICMKDYGGALKQLREMGVRHIGIYDAGSGYPRHTGTRGKEDGTPGAGMKKYHVGYVAGVFDLFHVGHLNLLRRAKEQCDYLIAGVVTDEGVRKNKHVEPAIPFEQRLAVVQGCRYVDEAVEIPLLYCDAEDAYRKYQFDVQFSGSDYETSPAWLNRQRFLREHGAELVFFPYTAEVSTSMIKSELKAVLPNEKQT